MTPQQIRDRLADPNCPVKWRQRYMQRAIAKEQAHWTEAERRKRAGVSSEQLEFPEVPVVGNALARGGKVVPFIHG